MTLKYVVDFNEDLLFRRKPVNSKQINQAYTSRVVTNFITGGHF